MENKQYICPGHAIQSENFNRRIYQNTGIIKMEYQANNGRNCGDARRLDARKHRLCGRKRAGGEKRGGGGEGVRGSYSSLLKIPQFSLFSAYVFRLLGPASHFDCTPHVNKPQRHTEATSPVKLRFFISPMAGMYMRNVTF